MSGSDEEGNTPSLRHFPRFSFTRTIRRIPPSRFRPQLRRLWPSKHNAPRRPQGAPSVPHVMSPLFFGLSNTLPVKIVLLHIVPPDSKQLKTFGSPLSPSWFKAALFFAVIVFWTPDKQLPPPPDLVRSSLRSLPFNSTPPHLQANIYPLILVVLL